MRYGRDPAQIIRQAGKLLKKGGVAFFTYAAYIRELGNDRVLRSRHKAAVDTFKYLLTKIKALDFIDD
jgi:hypothetical protein